MTLPTDFAIADGVLPIGHLLVRSARHDPDKAALVFPGRRVAYGELLEDAWAVARSLQGMGVRKGEHVGFLMTNHPDLVASFFGILLAGAVVVPINARYRTAEIDFLARDADLVAILTNDASDAHVDYSALLQEALPGLADAQDPLAVGLEDYPSLRSVVMLGNREPEGFVTRDAFDALAADIDQDAARVRFEGAALRETALILYTSGTTAAPRGAMLTHEAFSRGWKATGEMWKTVREDVHWSALPLFHVTALGCMTWIIGAGATFVTDYSFDAKRTLDALETERCTQFYPAYPPITEAIITHPSFAERDLSSLRMMSNVAPPEVLRKFQACIPQATQITVYGSTEGGCVTMGDPDESLEARLASCGRPIPGMELRVVDEFGAVAGPGTAGEIQFRGFASFSGYYNHPEKNREAFEPDGWFHTGDLGVLDEMGHVLFLGRIKETLKVGGENVAPQEIEEQLCTHPSVKLAAVVGVPDERLIEVAAAFVELVPGSTVDEAELIDHVKGKLASFKVPRIVRFIAEDEWPMSATKIKRVALRERLVTELEARVEA